MRCRSPSWSCDGLSVNGRRPRSIATRFPRWTEVIDSAFARENPPQSARRTSRPPATPRPSIIRRRDAPGPSGNQPGPGEIDWPAVPRPEVPCPGRPGRGLRRPDRELNREVALKAIQDRHAGDPYCRWRFLLEAEITGALEHPGIVPVYSLGHDDDGRPYYTMRLIRGESLRMPSPASTRPTAPSATRGSVPWRRRQLLDPVHRRLRRGRLCPQPGHLAPRLEAVQRDARPLRRDPGRRLGPGQVHRPAERRPDGRDRPRRSATAGDSSLTQTGARWARRST